MATMYPPRTGLDSKDRDPKASYKDYDRDRDRPRRRSPSPHRRQSSSPHRRIPSPRRRSPSPARGRGRRASPSYNEYSAHPPSQPSSSVNMYPNRVQGEAGGYRGGSGLGGGGGGGGAGSDYLDRYVILIDLLPLGKIIIICIVVESKGIKLHYLKLCGPLRLVHPLDQCNLPSYLSMWILTQMNYPRSPKRDGKSSKSKKKKSKRTRSPSVSSDSDDSEEERRRRRKEHKRRKEDKKEKRKSKRSPSRSRTPEPSHRSARTRSPPPSRSPEAEADEWVVKDSAGPTSVTAMGPPTTIPKKRSSPDDDESSEDEFGPQPAYRTSSKKFDERAYGSALLRGEGSAMAAFLQSEDGTDARIPRRGEIGLTSDEIARYEDVGYVMSGSRHRRMNAVRMRKENQVISAEEKRGILKLQKEERERREAILREEFSELVDERLKSSSKVGSSSK
jgi:hypothetical protein